MFSMKKKKKFKKLMMDIFGLSLSYLFLCVILTFLMFCNQKFIFVSHVTNVVKGSLRCQLWHWHPRNGFHVKFSDQVFKHEILALGWNVLVLASLLCSSKSLSCKCPQSQSIERSFTLLKNHFITAAY